MDSFDQDMDVDDYDGHEVGGHPFHAEADEPALLPMDASSEDEGSDEERETDVRLPISCIGREWASSVSTTAGDLLEDPMVDRRTRLEQLRPSINSSARIAVSVACATFTWTAPETELFVDCLLQTYIRSAGNPTAPPILLGSVCIERQAGLLVEGYEQLATVYLILAHLHKGFAYLVRSLTSVPDAAGLKAKIADFTEHWGALPRLQGPWDRDDESAADLALRCADAAAAPPTDARAREFCASATGQRMLAASAVVAARLSAEPAILNILDRLLFARAVLGLEVRVRDPLGPRAAALPCPRGGQPTFVASVSRLIFRRAAVGASENRWAPRWQFYFERLGQHFPRCLADPTDSGPDAEPSLLHFAFACIRDLYVQQAEYEFPLGMFFGTQRRDARAVGYKLMNLGESDQVEPILTAHVFPVLELLDLIFNWDRHPVWAALLARADRDREEQAAVQMCCGLLRALGALAAAEHRAPDLLSWVPLTVAYLARFILPPLEEAVAAEGAPSDVASARARLAEQLAAGPGALTPADLGRIALFLSQVAARMMHVCVCAPPHGAGFRAQVLMGTAHVDGLLERLCPEDALSSQRPPPELDIAVLERLRLTPREMEALALRLSNPTVDRFHGPFAKSAVRRRAAFFLLAYETLLHTDTDDDFAPRNLVQMGEASSLVLTGLGPRVPSQPDWTYRRNFGLRLGNLVLMDGKMASLVLQHKTFEQRLNAFCTAQGAPKYVPFDQFYMMK